MIFQRKMVISHDFTIILGVREKYFFAYPPRTKKNRVPGTRNSRKPSAASKTEPPNWGGTRLFFSRTGYETCHFYFFLRTGYATLRGTSVPECRVQWFCIVSA